MTSTKRKSTWKKAPSKLEIFLVVAVVVVIFAVEMGWVLG